MLVKYVFPVACLLSACVMNLFAAGAPLVVFDGRARGRLLWSDPKDITKFVLIDAAQTGGAKILRFEGGWKNYWGRRRLELDELAGARQRYHLF